MKIWIESADANGLTDGVTTGQLLDHLPKARTLEEADVVMIPVLCHPGYRFNHALNRCRGKKLVLLDYLEFGWDWNPSKENRIGHYELCPCTHTGAQLGEWGTLDLFIRENPPILTFKRECNQRDVADNFIPVDFLVPGPKFKLESEADFNRRQLDVFNCWGYSHPDRARVHGQIFEAMGNKGINVISAFDQVGGPSSHYFPAKTWCTIFSPYWVRRPMSEVYAIQSQAKITLNLPGAGRKCFREQEACNNSIMAMQFDSLARSYDWISGINCIKLAVGREVEDLIDATYRQDLYLLYKNCQYTADLYRRDNYIPNYILANIEKRL